MQDSSSLFASRKNVYLLGLAVLVVSILAGWFFTRFVTRTGDTFERERVIALASTAAASLKAEKVAMLKGEQQADTSAAVFIELRNQLVNVRNVNPDFRFIYLMRPSKNNPTKMIFLADAESSTSEDYSAPGDVYDGTSDALFLAYRTGQPQIEPPYHDRWGYWTTAVAPIRDEKTGQMIAILGMDIDASDWQASHARYRNFAISIVGLLTALALLFLSGLHLQQKAAAKIAEQLYALQQAQEGLRLADIVVKHTGEGIVVLDAAMAIQSVNPAFEMITGYSASEVLGKSPQLLEASEKNSDSFLQIHSRLQQGKHWEGTLWARRQSGENFPMKVNVDAVHSEDGTLLHHVMVFHDVTTQKALEDRLRELSSTDGLTLVANRRTFDETLEREWHRAMRNQRPVSLIMTDIDMFKTYNDLYGHPAGDKCLQQVAQAISSALDVEGGLLARYGGEEFAIILPEMGEPAARSIAEKIRIAVERLNIPHKGNKLLGKVTLSLGVSTQVPPQAADLIDLMQTADKALYRAKESGRNLVASNG
jgi:diguanylate cyclase (GGDEF)-like protein/PAS domain S-box-containing protein